MKKASMSVDAFLNAFAIAIWEKLYTLFSVKKVCMVLCIVFR